MEVDAAFVAEICTVSSLLALPHFTFTGMSAINCKYLTKARSGPIADHGKSIHKAVYYGPFNVSFLIYC